MAKKMTKVDQIDLEMMRIQNELDKIIEMEEQGGFQALKEVKERLEREIIKLKNERRKEIYS